MDIQKSTTFGALKKSGYQYKSIKDELRSNLLQKLTKKQTNLNGSMALFTQTSTQNLP